MSCSHRRPFRTPRARSAAFLALIGIAALVTPLSPASAARITAACTNNSSDAAKIQAKINSSAPGDTIVFEGQCLITTTITLLGDRAYQGDSRSTTLTASAGSKLPAVLASDSWVTNSATTGNPISLRDLTIDANQANPVGAEGGDGVVIRSWQTTVEDVTIRNARHNGLRITNQSKNGTALTNTQVNGTIRNVYIANSGSNGIYVQDSGNSITDWNLLDNWIEGSGQNAILSDNAAGWTIEGNHLYGVGAAGINASRLFATTVSDNYVEDFTTTGITVTVQGDAASTLIGNRIFQFTGSGTTYLAIARVNYGTGQVAVTGNVIRGNGTGTGLSYQRGNNQLTVTSTGNLVADVSTARTTGPGVLLDAGY